MKSLFVEFAVAALFAVVAFVPSAGGAPDPKALSLPTSQQPQSQRTFQHGLELLPATPEDEPPGRMVAAAVLMAAQASQGIIELPNGQVGSPAPGSILKIDTRRPASTPPSWK